MTSINKLNRTRADKSKYYIDSSKLLEQYIQSQTLGHATDDLARMFILVTDHLLKDFRFVRYNDELKEDMKSFALYKLLRSVRTFHSDTGAQSFNYITRITYTAFLTVLSKHYKFLNAKRAVLQHEYAVLTARFPASQRCRYVDKVISEE